MDEQRQSCPMTGIGCAMLWTGPTPSAPLRSNSEMRVLSVRELARVTPAIVDGLANDPSGQTPSPRQAVPAGESVFRYGYVGSTPVKCSVFLTSTTPPHRRQVR